MGLYEAMVARSTPVRVAVIGCGKFSTMFLNQARRVPNLQVTALVDLDPERARAALRTAGHDASEQDRVRITTTAADVIDASDVDVVVEATGHPLAGAEHALGAVEAGQHVVMVTVEADVLVGPLIAARAAEQGVVYSMASGDQPSLICEMVDWARTNGFDVVAAGKGTKYLPSYHRSTPETVWEHYGFTDDYARDAGLNPVMFNSFLDGTKSAIEMAAVANGTGLLPPDDGLLFPPAGADDLQRVCIPKDAGGVLERSGTVEVVASTERDGTPVARDLRWGVYVTFEAPNDYAKACFGEYGLLTDPSGRYSALYRPYHLIGLELAGSVVAAAVRGEPSGGARGWVADVAATAKRDLAPGEVLDGEGGATVYGTVLPSATSRGRRLLPIGLAGGARVVRPITEGTALSRDDVELDTSSPVHALRERLEKGGVA